MRYTRRQMTRKKSNNNSSKKGYNAVPIEVREESRIIAEIAGIQQHVYNGNGHHKERHKWIGSEFNPRTLAFQYLCHECGVSYPNKEICVSKEVTHT